MAIDNNQQFGPVDNVNINDMSGGDKKHNYRMIIITVVVLLVGIAGFIVSQNENLQQSMKRAFNIGSGGGEGTTSQGTVEIVESVVADPNIAWVEVRPEKPAYAMNETVVLYVSAFSEGKDITGYDMLLKVDPEMFELKAISSAVTGFTVFPFEKDTYIAVTGIKDIGTAEETIFNDTNILKVELTPKKKGTSIVGISLSEGKELSQLIDADVTVITPQVGTAKVQVD